MANADGLQIHFGGKRVLVTGAGKGIGRETAITLSRCGAEVFFQFSFPLKQENFFSFLFSPF